METNNNHQMDVKCPICTNTLTTTIILEKPSNDLIPSAINQRKLLAQNINKYPTISEKPSLGSTIKQKKLRVQKIKKYPTIFEKPTLGSTMKHAQNINKYLPYNFRKTCTRIYNQTKEVACTKD